MPTKLADPPARMMQEVQDPWDEAFDMAYVKNQVTAHETAASLWCAQCLIITGFKSGDQRRNQDRRCCLWHRDDRRIFHDR